MIHGSVVWIIDWMTPNSDIRNHSNLTRDSALSYIAAHVRNISVILRYCRN